MAAMTLISRPAVTTSPRWLAVAVAFVAGCAQTSAPAGGGTGTDTGAAAGQDTTTAKEVTPGADVAAGKDAPGDTGSQAGVPKTISEIQQHAASIACENKIINVAGLKGISINSVVVASQKWTVKAGAKEFDTIYVQSKGGGPWSGLYVLAEKSLDQMADVKPGDTVSLIGEIKEFYCLTELELMAKVTIETAAAELPVAVTVDVDALGAAKKADHEQYEGVLMRVEGVVSEPLADISTKDNKAHSLAMGKTDAEQTVLVGSGFGIYPQTIDGKANYKKGQKLVVEGFWDYSFEKFRIKPIKITVIP